MPAYDFWEHYIKNGISEAGYQWTECPDADWALALVPQSKDGFLNWKQDTWGKTVDWLKKKPADIFLSYLSPLQIDETAIKEIQKMGIPCVNFFCDHIRDFKRVPSEFEVFDLNWVPEYKAVNWYKKAGYPYINLPMPMWIEPQYRVLKEEKNDQVTFIGSMDIQRMLLFEQVLEQAPGLPLAIYGAGWLEPEITLHPVTADYTLDKKIMFNLNAIKQLGIIPYLRKIKHRNSNSVLSNALIAKIHASPTFEQYNALTAESMITLGINRYPSFHFPLYKPDTYSRLRDIEAPMLGACYLTEWTAGIGELYDIENEIVVYRNAGELAAKTRELRADINKRKMLRFNGRKRALNEHQISISLNKILQRLIH